MSAPGPHSLLTALSRRFAARFTEAERRNRWVLLAAILGSGMIFIDSTVVNLALPALQEDLAASVSEIQWVVEAYTLFVAALLLVGGALGDRLGRRLTFNLGAGIFGLASLLCGIAPDALTLILARGLQGIGGALLVPNSLALIGAAFDRRSRGRAIGIWSGFSAVATGLGLVLGGMLIDFGHWRLIFLINVPLAVLALWITWRHVPESFGARSRRLDWPGAGLATLGLGTVSFALIESTNLGLGHWLVLSCLTVGLVALVAFVRVEARAMAPMMPLELFRSPTFAGANLLTFLVYAALAGVLFLLPLNLVQVQGYSATGAGFAALPFILIIFTFSRWAGAMSDRFGPRRLLVVGSLLTAMGLLLLAHSGIGGGYWSSFFPGVALLGLGMALSAAPLTAAVVDSVEELRVGLASGVNNAISRAAALLAIALLGPLMFQIFRGQLLAGVAELDLDKGARAALTADLDQLAAIQLPPGLDGTLAQAVESAIDQAFVSGFQVAVTVTAILCLLGAGVAAWAVERPGWGSVPLPRRARD
ncbi:MAG: MFS transporter [Candidatus Competibacteraceae bacterium]|nr:MFS transporter [Candidatus Competibacteraceae bacterium]